MLGKSRLVNPHDQILAVPCGALTVIGVGTLPGHQEADKKETVAMNNLDKWMNLRAVIA